MLPRLLDCMAALIAALKSQGVAVETSDSFLLDLTEWPFQVPLALNGVPIQMNFAGSIPGWSDRVRYHLQVSLLGDRRWSMCEPPKGFNIPLIVSRILKQLDNQKRERDLHEQVSRDTALAIERLARLSEASGISRETPLRLSQDNVSIDALPEAPNDVLLTVRTSHANAERIAREFRTSTRRPRKG